MCFLLLIAASSANSALTLVIHAPLLTPGFFAMISLVTCGGWNFILICYSSFFNSLPTTSWVTGSLNIVSVSLVRTSFEYVHTCTYQKGKRVDSCFTDVRQ